jgi:hypothetical protein
MKGLNVETKRQALGADDRVREARKILDALGDVEHILNSKELGFFESMVDRLDGAEPRVSEKQIFWLRDIYERCVL